MKTNMTTEDLNVAILWLESNEGEGEEKAGCERAAAFLRKEYDRRIEDQIKRLAKRHGAPIDAVRSIILGDKK